MPGASAPLQVGTSPVTDRVPDVLLVRDFLIELPAVIEICSVGDWQRLHADISHEGLYLYALSLVSLKLNGFAFDVLDALSHLLRNSELLDRVVRQRLGADRAYSSSECLPALHVVRAGQEPLL